MNITLLTIYPLYFNSTGLCKALEEHCGHNVTQIVNPKHPEVFYNWPLHHRFYKLYDMPKVRECISNSDLIIINGIIIFHLWQTYSTHPQLKKKVYRQLDDFWNDVPDKAKTALIVSDSPILTQDWTDKIARFDTVLVMPDLFDYVQHPNRYPALQVNDVFAKPEVRRNGEKIIIGHSPGNKLKTNKKGTDSIRQVLIENDVDFEFRVLSGLTHDECIEQKQGMDIFIEQLQDPPQSDVGKGMSPFLGALGQSGQEGMCNGCATITSANLVSTEPYFPNPPVIIANTKATLKYEIENLLRHPLYRYQKAQQQYEWAKKYLNPEFVSKHIMECINAQPEIEAEWWEAKYATGGNSGWGSYGKPAKFKAEVINAFVKENKIASVIDFGCGDGNQLSLAEYPDYIGFDTSPTAVRMCQERFKDDKTKKFFVGDAEDSAKAQLALSLDVIYHLVEDKVFEQYMKNLFSAAERFVIIYSTNMDQGLQCPHIYHRCITEWTKANMPEWKLIKMVQNKDTTERSADFFIYEKK